MFGFKTKVMEIIKTEKLAKHFGDVHAVDGISLNIRKGEIYGFLGLNGAGKTTSIRMLLGMIKPTGGKAFINNKPVNAGNYSLWNDIGYLVEIPYSYPDLTVYENLEIIRKLRLIKDIQATHYIIDKLKLTKYLNRKAKNLSLGNAQRLGLAKALIHKPQILILDEPANGLDPAGIFEIRELLHDLAFNKGVTILISSHILDEVAKFTTRIGIIHEGRLIEEFNTSELDLLCEKKLMIKSGDNAKVAEHLKINGYSLLPGINGILESKDEKAIQHPENIATLMVEAGIPPSMIKVEQEDLESYFLKTIKKAEV